MVRCFCGSTSSSSKCSSRGRAHPDVPHIGHMGGARRVYDAFKFFPLQPSSGCADDGSPSLALYSAPGSMGHGPTAMENYGVRPGVQAAGCWARLLRSFRGQVGRCGPVPQPGCPTRLSRPPTGGLGILAGVLLEDGGVRVRELARCDVPAPPPPISRARSSPSPIRRHHLHPWWLWPRRT